MDNINGRLFEKWDKTLIVQKTCPGHETFWMPSLLSTLGFHCLIQDVHVSGWKQKFKDKQPSGNILQSYLFLVTKLSFGKTVSHFILSHFSDGLWI